MMVSQLGPAPRRGWSRGRPAVEEIGGGICHYVLGGAGPVADDVSREARR